jgi:hypothetical protein
VSSKATVCSPLRALFDRYRKEWILFESDTTPWDLAMHRTDTMDLSGVHNLVTN